jgi:hypothetical protein
VRNHRNVGAIRENQIHGGSVIDNSEALKKRALEIIKAGSKDLAASTEATQFATTMLTTLHGPESPQLRQFLARAAEISRSSFTHVMGTDYALWLHACGAIRNAVSEIDGGLILKLRVAVAGEVLAELLRLAKEILGDHTEEAKNVAAVLVAAGFEDLHRRMGEEFAGVPGRPDLQDVIIALKDKGVLKGGEIGTAQSYLKFRNDSLHADWKNVSRAQVESCVAFIEGLLVKHFT